MQRTLDRIKGGTGKTTTPDGKRTSGTPSETKGRRTLAERIAGRHGGKTTDASRKPVDGRTAGTPDATAARPLAARLAGGAAKGAGKSASAAGKGAAAVGRGAGRGAASAWRRTSEHRRLARAGMKRAARYSGGVALDALTAGVAGAAVAMWHVSSTRGGETMRRVWSNRRDRRRGKNAEREQRAAEQAAREAQSGGDQTNSSTGGKGIASSVRRPSVGAVSSNPTPQMGAAMSSGGGHHFTAGAEQMAQAAASYHPTGMMEVGRDFASLPEALDLVAEAMKTSVEQADAEFPLEPRVIEVMQGIHDLLMKASEMAAELPSAFQAAHEPDIARHENPRTGEQMWDVAANDGASTS